MITASEGIFLVGTLSLLLTNKNIRKFIPKGFRIICEILSITFTYFIKEFCIFLGIDTKCSECHGSGYCNYDSMDNGATYEKCRKCHGSGYCILKIPLPK